MDIDFTQLNLATLSSYFVKYQNKIDEIEEITKKKVDELTAGKEALKAEIRKRMEADGLKNMKTAEGLFHYTTKTRCTKKDGEALLEFAKEHSRFDLLNIQPLKTACVDFIKTTQTIPPGVHFEEWQELGFRKA